MPLYATGDMFSVFDKVDHFIITTNAIVKKDGALVMGRGIAKTCRDRWSGLDKALGTVVMEQANPSYGCIIGKKLGIFQVKHHWKANAHLRLILESTEMLREHALIHPNRTYALNYPGIGHGRLSKKAVES